jgi:hypothetical protein
LDGICSDEHIYDNDAQLVDAVVYKANVIQAKAGEGMCARMNQYRTQLSTGGAAPAWFHNAMAVALQPMDRRLDAIEVRLDGMDRRLDAIEVRLAHIERTQAIVRKPTLCPLSPPLTSGKASQPWMCSW